MAPLLFLQCPMRHGLTSGLKEPAAMRNPARGVRVSRQARLCSSHDGSGAFRRTDLKTRASGKGNDGHVAAGDKTDTSEDSSAITNADSDIRLGEEGREHGAVKKESSPGESPPESLEAGALRALKPTDSSSGSTFVGGKWTSISGRASAMHLIMEPLASVSGLAQYLALPVEEYSLLDPTWIEKEDDDVFHFKIPLAEMGLAMRLEPQTWVKVDIDPKKEEVRFSSSRFMVGDAELDTVLDERLQFEFEATMGYKSMRRYRKASDVKEKDDRVTRILQVREADGAIIEAHAQMEPAKVDAALSGIAADDNQDESHSSEDANPEAKKDFLPDEAVQVSGLNLDVRVKMQVRLPQKSVVGSGLVLKGMGKLVLKAALQALAPAFVRLVSEDYKQWVAKEGKGTRDAAEGGLIDVSASSTTDIEMAVTVPQDQGKRSD